MIRSSRNTNKKIENRNHCLSLKQKHTLSCYCSYSILRMPAITGDQKLSTFGLLGATALAVLFSDNIPSDYVIAGAVGFGTGVAISNAFYRVAELLKNGKAEKNEFGKGTLAGVSLFCGLLGLKSIPYMLKTFTNSPFKLSPEAFWLTLGALGFAGFLQNRNAFLSFVTEESNEKNQGQ